MKSSLGLRIATGILLATMIEIGWALPHPQPYIGTLTLPTTLDVFDDTIRYDDGVIQWWYGGLNNFYLITRFTPAASFNLQRVVVALKDSNTTTPISLWLKEDVSGVPGPVLWSGRLLYNQPQTWLGATLSNSNQYTFSSGESFWLELRSPGPPYECYDESQLQPPRSFTNYPTPSPGDNFIRAVGEYTAAVVDVGVDSIWHGGDFFVPGSHTYQVGCRVRNYGSQPANFTVSCSLFAAAGTALISLGTRSGFLASGGAINVSFSPLAYSAVGAYFFRARTNLIGDGNPENNTAEIETQIYVIPPQAELCYDDGISIGAAFTPMPGDGWGMKFDPQQAGYYRVSGVKVCVSTTGRDLPARVQLLMENPATNSPGAILWQTVQSLSDGWNSFSMNKIVSGSVYLSYIFENGSSSPALSYDHPPTSGECWAKTNGAWIKGSCLNDWMVRALIDTSIGPSSAQVWVTLTPMGSPFLPPSGDTLYYNITAGNSGIGGQTVDVWLSALLPNGSIYGPMAGPFANIQMRPGFWISHDQKVYIAGHAPAGNYKLIGYIGDYNPPNNTIYAADSISFQKAVAAGADESLWFASSDDPNGPAGVVDAMPDAFGLEQNHPNPFNATTAIRFELPAASFVRLDVYDISGRVAATLVNSWRQAGKQEVTLDASGLPSGIYICRLQAGEFSAAQKLVLLK